MTNDGRSGLKTLVYCLLQLTVIHANELNTVFLFLLSFRDNAFNRVILFLYHFPCVIKCQKSNGYTYIIRIIVVFDWRATTCVYKSRVDLRSFASRDEGCVIPPLGSCVYIHISTYRSQSLDDEEINVVGPLNTRCFPMPNDVVSERLL